jgi:hypothetical protein
MNASLSESKLRPIATACIMNCYTSINIHNHCRSSLQQKLITVTNNDAKELKKKYKVTLKGGLIEQ